MEPGSRPSPKTSSSRDVSAHPLGSKPFRFFLVLAFLVPIGLGMVGGGMHFIPNPSYRWIAVAAALGYAAAFVVFVRRKGLIPATPDHERIPRPAMLVFGILMSTYFFYVTVAMTAPALLTQAIGKPKQGDYVVEDLRRGGFRATLCPFRMRLQGVTTVLDDSYCVSENFARAHANGESLHLAGLESALGFRFLNVD